MKSLFCLALATIFFTLLSQTGIGMLHDFYQLIKQSHYSKVSSSSCQAYPSEYAYQDNSVSRTESISANCRRYQSGLQERVYTEEYIHCDGTQLKLTDSDIEQKQYQTTDYYRWSTGSDEQLLFTFPTRVSLTTITLHYYSDNFRSLPRLRFYAVPDDFDVWDIIITNYSHVDVAEVQPGGEPVGRRNVTIIANFHTSKVLMHKYSSSFLLSVSEVEFFTCISTCKYLPLYYHILHSFDLGLLNVQYL